MSLINQVLRDLERRQAGESPAATGSPPLLYAAPRRSRRVWPYLLVLAGAVAYWRFGEHAFLQWENKPQAIASAKLAPPTPRETVALERTPSSQAPPQAVAPIPAAAESPPAPPVPAAPEPNAPPGAQASRLPGSPNSAALLRQASPESSRRASPESAKGAIGEVSKAVSPADAGEGQAGRLRSQGEPPSPPRKAEPAKPPPLPPRPAVLRPSGEDAEGLFRRATRLATEGETGQARAMLERALREQPGHSQARALLGRLLIQQGDWTDAAVLLDKAAAPTAEADNELAQLRARVLLQQNQTEQAVAVLENARAHAPADGKTLGMLGAAYHALGRYAEAAAAYRQALRLQSAEPRWWLGLAVALDGNKQAAEALPAYREVLARGRLEERVLSYARERIQALEASAVR